MEEIKSKRAKDKFKSVKDKYLPKLKRNSLSIILLPSPSTLITGFTTKGRMASLTKHQHSIYMDIDILYQEASVKLHLNHFTWRCIIKQCSWNIIACPLYEKVSVTVSREFHVESLSLYAVCETLSIEYCDKNNSNKPICGEKWICTKIHLKLRLFQ